MKPNQHEILLQFEHRRRNLGLSRSALARRSRVSLPTVNRILSGQYHKASLANVLAVAEALGLKLGAVPSASSDMVRAAQARRKALRLVRLVQGTSALEGQGLDPLELEAMVARTVRELLQSKRRLWSE